MTYPDSMLEANHDAPEEVYEVVTECSFCGWPIHTGERYFLIMGDPACEECKGELVEEMEA